MVVQKEPPQSRKRPRGEDQFASRMGKDAWWDWRSDRLSWDDERRPMSEDQRKTAFENLAERCVVLDNLASNVTQATVRSALGQFGTVLGVKMVINPANMKFIGAAIAEMQNKDQRDQVVKELREYLFMVGAMPRPARAIPATPLLLIDHPWRRNPNKIRPRLVSKTDPSAEALKAREHKARVQADDNEQLHLVMEREEIQLEKAQEKSCQELMDKLKMIAKEVRSGTIREMKVLHGLGPHR
ncbi:unnamed protein product [Calypogeia fissa]